MSRATPGIQLSVGRLRVDAAKAIAKLREYQLADHTAWVLEAIRAAVASGATRIELTGDANDVWLAWEGPAWPTDDLPRLFDELVSPEPVSERHHIRLLAAAVNSALGMNPAYVDVFAIADDGATRARYTPDVLEETDAFDGESALRAVAAVAATPPAGVAPSTGMLVHLRRRTSLSMLTYLFWERRPAELALAAAQCRDITVPLHVDGEVLCRAAARDDLDRIALADGIDGFVALVDPDRRLHPEAAAVLQVAERGVVLATYPIVLGPAAPLAPVPLRLFVDAPRMPTNASRSQVRREAHPIADAEKQAPALARQLVTRLVKRLEDDDGDDRERERARRAAIALVATEVAGASWEHAAGACTAFADLAELPLVRDATGAPAAIARTWNGMVHARREPLDPALAPWLGDMLWIPPGDPAARLVGDAGLSAGATRRRIKWARQQLRAQRAFFDHAPRAARLRLHRKERTRVRFELATPLRGSCVADDQVAMTGEVCIFPQRTYGEVTLLFQGRQIETVALGVHGIGFSAIVDSDRLIPIDRYRGVMREAEYERAITAVRCAIVRGIEAIAMHAAGALPDGFDGDEPAGDDDARLIRQAIDLLLQLKLPVAGPLASAKVWRTTTGVASVQDLRLHKVLGATTTGTLAAIPRHRVIVTGTTRDRLAKLVPWARIVVYDTLRARGTDAAQLAARLEHLHVHALEIRDGELCGAIAVASTSRIRLCHLGVELDDLPYAPKLLPGCHIVVDSDAVVPDDTWTEAVDDAGIARRNFYDWELALVRAAARTLVGAAPSELHAGEVTLDGPLGRAVIHVLGLANAESLLGPDLLAQLRTRPLLRALGHIGPVSIEEVATWFPGNIPYVAPREVGSPVAAFAARGEGPPGQLDFARAEGPPGQLDYRPLLADPSTARAFASLVGRDVTDGTETLARRRREAIRRARLAAHRARFEMPLVFTGTTPHIPLDPRLNGLRARGHVGVGHGRLDIEVRIEGRPFQRIERPGELPLTAVVEIDAEHTDATFEALPVGVVEDLIAAVDRTVGPLLAHVARTSPQSIGELGVVRTLLAGWVRRTSIDRDTRAVLRDAPAWPSVRGDVVSLERASQPHGVLSIAAWEGDWQAPGDGEPPAELDRDILHVPTDSDEIHAILAALDAGPLVDVTAEVTRLQNQRRMARGLIPAPSLPHVPAPLKRKLRDLGDTGRKLGLGEVGLVEGTAAALLHEHGRLRDRVELDVIPPIHLAIEAPELVGSSSKRSDELDLDGSITEMLRVLHDTRTMAPAAPASADLNVQAQALAGELVRQIVANLPHDALPPAIRTAILRGVLAHRIPPRDVVGVPAVETSTGVWVPYERLVEEAGQYGDLWVLPAGRTTQLRPLDERRLVFVMAPEIGDLAARRFTIADALHELDQDAKAHRNRERPRATELVLPEREFLAQIELDEGKLRGVVGVLAPRDARLRAVFAHRAMHPFDPGEDPCKWPTIAVLDDERLEPDRTWSAPLSDRHWKSVQAKIRTASERALARVVEPPIEALATHVIGPTDLVTIKALRGTDVQVRGALWLAGAPRTNDGVAIKVVDGEITRTFRPEHDLGMSGLLYVHAAFGWPFEDILEELCARLHGLLVRQLVALDKANPEIVQAHVAHAIALSRVQPAHVPRMTFDCFRPEPLDAVALTAVVRGSGPQTVVGLLDLDGAGVLDDDSPVSRVVIAAIGSRARRWRPPEPRDRDLPPPANLPRDAVLPSPLVPSLLRLPTEVPQPPPEPKRRHPLDDLVRAVRERLADFGVPDVECQIVRAEEPLLRGGRTLRFAGDSPRLHAIANAMAAKSPWAALALDALVAHAITVLDEALTTITPATQMQVLARLFGTAV